MNSKKDYKEVSLNFMRENQHGILCTHSKSNPGFPFGSVVPYLMEDDNSLIIYISFIAEHYKNLAKDPRASIIVADPSGLDDPQAHARCTVLVEFSEIAPEERDRIQERYLDKFPGSINYEIAHNFTYMRGKPNKLRWIAGFGKMGWVELS